MLQCSTMMSFGKTIGVWGLPFAMAAATTATEPARADEKLPAASQIQQAVNEASVRALAAPEHEPVISDERKPISVELEPEAELGPLAEADSSFSENNIDYKETDSYKKIFELESNGELNPFAANFLGEELKKLLLEGLDESKFLTEVLGKLPEMEESQSFGLIDELLADETVTHPQAGYLRAQFFMRWVRTQLDDNPNKDFDRNFIANDLFMDSTPLDKVTPVDIRDMGLLAKMQLINSIHPYLSDQLKTPELARRLAIIEPVLSHPTFNSLDMHEFSSAINFANTIIQLHKNEKISDETLLGFFELGSLARLLNLNQNVPSFFGGQGTYRAKAFELFNGLLQTSIDNGILTNNDWEDLFRSTDISVMLKSWSNGSNMELYTPDREKALLKFAQVLINNALEKGVISAEDADRYQGILSTDELDPFAFYQACNGLSRAMKEYGEVRQAKFEDEFEARFEDEFAK